MAFDYGKDTLGIKNPFKFEGILILIKGGIITTLGILLIFDVRATLEMGSKANAWIELGVALVFLSLGLIFLVSGGMKLFRFLVGRSIPADLSDNPEIIEEMLMKRMNPNFEENNSYVSRLVISAFHQFLFLPKGYRIIVESITAVAIETATALVLFLLALFSTSIGLIEVNSKSIVIEWLGLILVLYLFIVWKYKRPNQKILNDQDIKPTIKKNLPVLIAIAVLTPVILHFLFGKGISLPALNIPVVLFLSLFLIFAIIAVVAAFWLAYFRANEAQPETSVSEYKEHLQFNMHPKDLFRCYELEMMKQRYKEIPHRIYKNLKPVLHLEGSENKGSFEGGAIQETQPVFQELTYPKNFYTLRAAMATFGHLLAVIASLILFLNISDLSTDSSFKTLFLTIFYPALFYLFSNVLVNIVHPFYSEMLFKSYLVHFFADGTYTESKVSTGMAYYDSNRSENTVLRTSATPWLLVSKIVTSTFADSSTNNLEGSRYVMEMYKADAFRDEIVKGIKYYLENQELLANIESKKDLDNTAKYYKINEATRGKMQDNPEKYREIDSSTTHNLDENTGENRRLNENTDDNHPSDEHKED